MHRPTRFVVAAACAATAAALLATPAAAGVPATATFATVVGDDGWVGGTDTILFAAPDATIDVGGDASGIVVTASTSQSWYELALHAPAGQVLHTGTYDLPTFATQDSARIGVSGDGRSCGDATGRFVVRDVHTGANGVIDRFSATYEQHCNGGPRAVIGEISVNEPAAALVVANDTVDFAPGYPGVASRVVPVWVVNRSGATHAVTPALSGADPGDFTVVSDGCGAVAAGATCSLGVRWTPGAPGPRSATLTLADGSGWTRAVPLAGKGIPGVTAVHVRSQPGDYVGAGGSYDFTPASTYYVTARSDGTRFDLDLEDAARVHWSFTLMPAPGDVLQAGRTYPGATRALPDRSGPGLNVDGDHRGCNTLTGTFTVLEAAYDPATGVLQRFAAFAEQHCEGATPWLRAWVSWRATVANDPLAVLGLAAHPTATSIGLTWNDPDSSDFAATVVRYAEGLVPPASPTSGTPLYDGTGESATLASPAAGKSYAFAVWTRDTSGGYGPRATLTLRGTVASLVASPSTLSYGRSTTLTARLTDAATGAPVAGRAVAIDVRPTGTTAFTRLGTFTTNASGVAAVPFRPARHVEARATFLPAGDHLAATSPLATVTVRAWVGASLSRTTIRRNGWSTLDAAVAPSHAGQTVYLQRWYSGSWHTVGAHVLGSNSAYGFVLHPASPGTYVLRVYKPADADHAAGYSASRTLTVT